MLAPLATRWHISSYSMKPFQANIERKMLGYQAFFPEQQFHLSSANTTQTIAELFAWSWRELLSDNLQAYPQVFI